MAKLKNPLSSFGAVGRLGDAITLRGRRRQTIAEKPPIPTDARTPPQLAWRHMYQKAVDLWHGLNAEEKQEWESLARPKQMTGFSWFISQALKPNPGLYLPLQGGIMQGDIDMAKYRLLKLPLPTDDQEAATKKYHDDNLMPPYTSGIRVYRDTWFNCPNDANTYITFTHERYKTNIYFSPGDWPNTPQILTAGVYYLAATIMWNPNATGYRAAHIDVNRTYTVASVQFKGDAAFPATTTLSICTKLEVDDFIDVKVYQNSGGALAIWQIDRLSPEFCVQRIG